MNPASTSALPPAVLLMGPTASGKSALALEIARRVPVEVISVDSAQVYRGMDVGTAKPTRAERAALAHHLIDIVDPDQSYSAAQFRSDAARLLDEISARGRVPLLVGGTMLYFKALLEGLSALPAADAAMRATLEAQAAEQGWPALHAELARVDPATAARLQPSDAQRIQRALEVYRLSGIPLSRLQGARVAAAPKFDYLQIALMPSDRGELHRRIEQRFDAMLRAGLVEELAGLRRRYALHPGLPAMRCVGYRQAWTYLEGACDREALRARGVYATRQLAKRQMTWLRSMPDLEVMDCLSPDLAGRALRFIETQVARN